MNTYIEFFVTVLLMVSFWGWGYLLQSFAGKSFSGGINLLLGLASLNVLGGWFVYLGWVSSEVFFLLWAIGLISSALGLIGYLRKSKGFINTRKLGWGYVRFFYPWLIVAGVGLILFCGFHDSRIFNYHDDFEKYLKYPVQLLEAGHLRTGLFDSIGIETLGGQSFFQAFILTFGGITSVPLFDSVICQLILLIFVMSLVQRPLIRVFLALMILSIDPLMLNVSSIYSGALAYGLIMFGMCQYFLQSEKERLRSVVIISLGIALSVSLKLSLALVVPFFFVSFLCVSTWRIGFKESFKNGVVTVGLSCFFALPWFLIQFDKIGTLILNLLKNLQTTPPLPTVEKTWFAIDFEWFQFGPYLYGHHCNVGQYSLFFFVLVSMGLILLYSKKLRSFSATHGLIVCLVSTAISYLWLMEVFASLMGQPHAVRYCVPLFMAMAVPFAIFFQEIDNKSDEKKIGRRTQWFFLGNVLFVILIFSPSILTRMRKMFKREPLIAIPQFGEADYVRYCDWSLSDSRKQYLCGIQALTPATETIMVWCIGAFNLDYSRNVLQGVDPAGLTAPWVLIPQKTDLKAGIDYLKSQNIHYILWQYEGLGVRNFDVDLNEFYPLDQNFFIVAWRFSDFLLALSKNEDVEMLYEDKSFRLMKINGESLRSEHVTKR